MKRARFSSMFAAACLPVTFFAVLGASPARADPLPEDQRMTMLTSAMPRASSAAPGGALVVVQSPSGMIPIAGTSYNLTMFSCGRLVAGDNDPLINEVRGVSFSVALPTKIDTVGPTLDFRVEVTHPGFDTYALNSTESMAEHGLRTPSCDAVDAPDADFDDPVVVTKASKARTGRPRVGRKASITPTRFADVGNPYAEYLWYVGKKHLKTMYAAGRGRTIKVKPRWKGRPLFAVVYVSDSSMRTEDSEQVIKFGRIRG